MVLFLVFATGNTHDTSKWYRRLLILKETRGGFRTLASYSPKMYFQFTTPDYRYPEGLGFYITITVWDEIRDVDNITGEIAL